MCALPQARHAAVEFLKGGGGAHHHHNRPHHGQGQPHEEGTPSSHSSASSSDAFHASSGGSGCETPTTGGSAEEGTPLRVRYGAPRPSSSAASSTASSPALLQQAAAGNPNKTPAGATPLHGRQCARAQSAPVQARAWQQLPPIPTWAEMDALRQGSAPMAVRRLIWQKGSPAPPWCNLGRLGIPVAGNDG